VVSAAASAVVVFGSLPPLPPPPSSSSSSSSSYCLPTHGHHNLRPIHPKERVFEVEGIGGFIHPLGPLEIMLHTLPEGAVKRKEEGGGGVRSEE